MVGRNPPWSDLPQELLSAIANFLTSNPISIFTFRSICRSWRSSCLPLPPNSPFLSSLLPLSIPPPSNPYRIIFDRITILSVTKIYALHRPLHQAEPEPGYSSLSPNSWIVFVDEFTPRKLIRCKVDPRKNDKRTKFKVYELNEGMKKWSEITSLGDRSFLFGRNFSFSASARELGPCVKNCILFARFSFLSYNWTDDGYYKCHSILENNGLDIEVFHLHDADISGVIESYPGYSDSIWPPPSWIWPIDRLKRIGIIETAIDKILDKFTEKFKMEVEKAQQGFIPEDLKVILKLKDVVSGFKEEEIEFMTKLRQSMDILNKEDSLFEQATCSHGSDGTTEERHGWLDMLGNFYTDKPTHDHLLHSAMSMSRIRDASLLYIEEQATEALKRKRP
ncbi:hypothetical protein KSS87_014809 [Heliosperma pusillum]|nr:hypothetical protein KSS87_014809 [Heliosperma pusillum]